jgi:hypothetical protein
MLKRQVLMCGGYAFFHCISPLRPLAWWSTFLKIHLKPINLPYVLGTGRRQFPASVATEEDDRATATRSDLVDFQKKTTQECYEEFPVLVRSSVPLYVVTDGPQVMPWKSFCFSCKFGTEPGEKGICHADLAYFVPQCSVVSFYLGCLYSADSKGTCCCVVFGSVEFVFVGVDYQLSGRDAERQGHLAGQSIPLNLSRCTCR